MNTQASTFDAMLRLFDLVLRVRRVHGMFPLHGEWASQRPATVLRFITLCGADVSPRRHDRVARALREASAVGYLLMKHGGGACVASHVDHVCSSLEDVVCTS